MGLSDSSQCSFCQSENETIAHLSFNCHVTSKVWSDLRVYFSSKLNIPPLTLQSAVIGFLDKCDENIFLNNILLMYKITIYRNRAKTTITARNVLSNLKNRENIEKSIAFSNNKIDFHRKKWHILHSFNDAEIV